MVKLERSSNPFSLGNWKYTKDETGEYDLEVLIVSSGLNHHERFRITGEHIERSIKFNGFDYTVDPNRFFKKDRNVFSRFKDYIIGVKERFLIVFEINNQYAFPQDLIADVSPKKIRITAHDLFNIMFSSGFKRAFAELFSGGFGGKKILFILGIALIGGIAFMVLTGRIKL